MKTLIWIQNSDENKEDFLFDDLTLMDIEDRKKRQDYISEILSLQKKGEKILDELHLKINKNYKSNTIIVDLKSDDLDKYGRKGAVMIYIKEYEQETDELVLKERLNTIFSQTGTIVLYENIDKILNQIKKKNKSSKIFFIVTILLAIFLFSIIIYNNQK